MVERTIEPEVEKVFDAIERNQNFILEGGAGSGKTYSLIVIIEKISRDEPDKSIVCITYTNNAVAEIRERITNDKLKVSTIHEFIWYIIGKFQKEIKLCLIELINDDEQKAFIRPLDNPSEDPLTVAYFENTRVDYGERYSMSIIDNRVQISHDHILILAEKMFSTYPKLCDILIDTADYIFVDEYQDTSPLVVKILLEYVQNRTKKNIVGFFGDSMQAIYDSGVGDLSSYNLEKIAKAQNRRNPKKVIDLANKFRDDGLVQTPSNDDKAPNMDNGSIIPGTVKFVYGSDIKQLEILRGSQLYRELEFNAPQKTKELRLTHKLNAEMAGFSKLFELYNTDLFVKLITGIKKKINKDKIVDKGKTFEELVEEAKISVGSGGPLIIDVIKSTPELLAFYDEIKTYPFEEVISKCKVNKDSLLAYKFNGLSSRYEAGTDRDRILKRLDLIYELLELYKTGKHNEFLRITKFNITSSEDKISLSKVMTKISVDDITIGEVIELAEESGLISKDDLFTNFIESRGHYLWSRLKIMPFQEYVNSIAYLREYVSVITQHKVKGSEYENVLVLLDNGQWNQYNFDTLFGKGSPNENVQNRTRKLFYVTITRAMKNLIIYMPSNDKQIIEKAQDYFELDDIVDVLSFVDV
ncbi:TPA: ATP-dependent helicase [Streptococcus suis]|uniref:UvrD-helicase domain-containing protein n=1 Tax=Streptococcus TaxID=1301 RepID=UPI002AA4E52F|nr:ATP-dependent helicase [Streptococcus suis]HEM3477408.1 ATP-dependent helicase [Streptococcus suis]HEM3483869.1 ATP-dependent helicase [Streptococcus suis]